MKVIELSIISLCCFETGRVGKACRAVISLPEKV